MNALRQYLELRLRANDPLASFLLAHGKDYALGPQSFAGKRGEQGMCYMNAAHLALDNTGLTYVEGMVSVCGIHIDHAWCVSADGIVIDPTLANGDDIAGYFGVPFLTDYVRKACLRNGVYGLLGYELRKTLSKLVELGLQDGQRWLIGGRRKAASS